MPRLAAPAFRPSHCARPGCARRFCAPLGYHVRYLWFRDREFRAGSFDHSSFAQNYARVRAVDVVTLFCAEVYDWARPEGWPSAAHCPAAGPRRESWASLQSFVRQAGSDAQKVAVAKDPDPGHPSVNCRGEQWGNDTHPSPTDPASVLDRQAAGKEARLGLGGHLLLANRQGLCADFTLPNPLTAPAPVGALRQLDAHPQLQAGVTPPTSGGDKGYPRQDWVRGCRERELAPPTACQNGLPVPGLDTSAPHGRPATGSACAGASAARKSSGG